MYLVLVAALTLGIATTVNAQEGKGVELRAAVAANRLSSPEGQSCLSELRRQGHRCPSPVSDAPQWQAYINAHYKFLPIGHSTLNISILPLVRDILEKIDLA